jgi:hypothetical protein
VEFTADGKGIRSFTPSSASSTGGYSKVTPNGVFSPISSLIIGIGRIKRFVIFLRVNNLFRKI